jgi:nitroimidazol reductase NimA-like FMN-containing flavoprotein (pyridoxamine 5'-phosphate oxidase superfamily)
VDTTQYRASEHSRVSTHADRASYDRDLINSILDGASYCHVGFVSGGRPVVIPMLHAREGGHLFLHGSPGSRMLNDIVSLPLVCVVATILDGLFVGPAVVDHGFNYRSVVVFGPATAVESISGKRQALRALTEKAAPGRWDLTRQPTDAEVAATRVVSIEIAEASAKTRSGGPGGSEEGYPGAWTGVIPYSLVPGEPIPDPSVPPGAQPPAGLLHRLTT